MAHAAWILAHSAEAFSSVGTQGTPGTKLVSIYGKVGEPGLVEVPMGMQLGEIIGLAGGPVGGVKAVFVGGAGGGALGFRGAAHAV